MKPVDPLAEERTFARRWLRPAAALVGGASIALLAASSPVVAGHSPVGGASPPARGIEVEIEGPAVKSANGAVVLLPVSIACSAGPDAYIYGDLIQTTVSIVRSGYGQVSATCDGHAHLVTLPIVANRLAFRLGKAYARVQAYQNDGPDYLSDADQEEVVIRLH